MYCSLALTFLTLSNTSSSWASRSNISRIAEIRCARPSPAASVRNSISSSRPTGLAPEHFKALRLPRSFSATASTDSPQRLHLLILRVIEGAGARAWGPGVGERLPSLESDFHVTFARLIEPVVTVRDVEDLRWVLRAHLKIAVHSRRIDLRPIATDQFPHLRPKMPASFRLKRHRPLRRRQPGIGEIHLNDGIGRCHCARVAGRALQRRNKAAFIAPLPAPPASALCECGK